ncbi:unnamed protein product [Heligmosomoides polygyrus]|uniref:DUF1330 domain-containing protein n=1 Tax=Heligmosomoides polygyrus TaxID=6339 RepID=A0A183FHH7_HELPZ|nr:unnamed protein product [Heligmosomoides polygyrus]
MVCTLTGRSCELVETLERMRVDFCAVQKTRWSCCKSSDIGGFKAVLCGSPRTTSGVGIIVYERFRDTIVSVERYDDRLMKIVVGAKERLYHFFSTYAPQTLLRTRRMSFGACLMRRQQTYCRKTSS